MLRAFLLTTCLLGMAGAEYVWDGTEWKWNEPALGTEVRVPSQNNGGSLDSGVIEGSGDDYDDNYDEEDYDDDYEEDYGDDYGGKSNTNSQSGFNNPVLGSSDDEDMVEGSGDSDHVVNHIDSGFVEKEKEPVTETQDYKEEDIYVDPNDHTNFGDYPEETDDSDDISFYGENTEDDRVPFVEVTSQPKAPATTTTTTTTTQKPVWDGGNKEGPEVHRKGPTSNRPASFFAQPGILAAVIGGAVVGLLCAILLVMFIVYRMRKKDEGSYALDEPKRSHNVNSYSKPPSREFYA